MSNNRQPKTRPARHSPGTPWLEAATDAANLWFASLEAADRELATATRKLLPDVRRQALARTLLTLGRERLVPVEPPTEGDYRCDLPGGDCTLYCEWFRGSEVLLRSDLRNLRACWQDGTEESIEHPARLLEIVADGTKHDVKPWKRLAEEISDSVFNEALALAAHHKSNATLPPASSNPSPEALIQQLQRSGPAPDAALFLDQWAATGHPMHTVPKTRMGLSPAEALKICPEFHPHVPVRLAAVRRDRVSAELPKTQSRVSDCFAQQFPEWFQAWRDALKAKGRDSDDYEPFPVHPWQAEHVIAQIAAEQLKQGEIDLLDGPTLAMLSGLSVRSLVPAEQTSSLGFKLPLGLRLTSSVRTITPRSCHMGRRVGRMLRTVFENDPNLRGRIDVLDEPIGAHFDSGGALPELEKHFNFIAREPVSNHIGAGHIAALPAALAEPFPVGGPPLLLGLATGKNSLSVFEQYTRDFLSLVLRTYLIYGIAIEAHGQNMLACFNEQGELKKFLYRDLAGIRIHEPTLKRLGIELDVHPDRRTVVQDFNEHRIWLRHRAYHSHLGHIAHGLSVATGEAETRYWRLAGDITAEIFNQLRSQVDPTHWKRERHALLEAPWSGKAYLSMRLEDQVRDLTYAARNLLAKSNC